MDQFGPIQRGGFFFEKKKLPVGPIGLPIGLKTLQASSSSKRVFEKVIIRRSEHPPNYGMGQAAQSGSEPPLEHGMGLPKAA